MKYYMLLNYSDPSAPTYKKPQAVFRCIDVGNYQIWKHGSWEDNVNLFLRVSGMGGGGGDTIEIDKVRAKNIIEGWGERWIE